MKKRLAALLLILIMLLSCVLTSCNLDEGEIEQTETRRPLTITLYCVTGDETTPEAVKKVQDAINSITKKRFKTQIILRLYKESDYVNVVDNLVADIALEEQKKADDASASASAAKESKRIAAIDKLIAADKAEVTTRSLIIWHPETEEQTEEETYETEKNILNENVEKYPEVRATQLDIFLICGTDNLYKYVNDEKYATDGEPFLVSMDESLSLSAKSIKQYVNPTVLLAGKVNNSQYAIPTNKQIADTSMYLVLNKAMLKEFGAEENSIKNFTSAAYIDFMQKVKDSGKGYIPLLSEVPAPGIVSVFGEESIFGTYVANTAVAGFKAVPKNLLSAYQYTDHIIYMEQYKRNGFVGTGNEEKGKWASAVITATADEIAEYSEDEYVVKVLGKGMATNETVGQYMFGISKYAANPDRCMEIITYLTTNSEIRNLLQYGVEGYNYKIDIDSGKLQRLNHEYMMDIFTTGNTFIAYPEEDMPLDVWEKAKEANKTAIVSPYMGFIYEKPETEELIAKMKALSASVLEKIKNYDLEKDRAEKKEKINKSIADAEEKLKELKEKLDAVAPTALSYIERRTAAEEALVPYTEALNEAKAAIAPYDTVINKCKSDISSLNNRIKVEKAKKPTEADPNLGPDQALIDEWTAEIEQNELTIREQRGYSYELRKELAEAQAAYDEKYAELKKINDEYQNRKYSDDPEVMKIYEDELNRAAHPELEWEELTKEEADSRKKIIDGMNKLQTSYEARLNNYNAKLKEIEDYEKELETYNVPEQSEIDADYAKVCAEVDELTALTAKLEEEKNTLEASAESARKAVEDAKAALEAAKAVLDEKQEAFAPFNKENAIALSYIEDKETEIAAAQKKLNDENAKASPSEAKISEYTTQLETLNAELAELKATYDATVAKGAAEKQAYETALAEYTAKEEALKAAENAEALTQLEAKKTELAEASSSLKKATKTKDEMLQKDYEYYDVMAKTLYGAFFKSLIAECEENDDYKLFMNVGEELADDEKGIVAAYNTWYESMYGAG